MPLEQLLDKLRQLKISEIEAIMSIQGSNMESPVSDTQVKDSGVKEDQLKPENTGIKEEQQEIILPIEGIYPVPFPSLEMESHLTSASGIQVEDLEVKKGQMLQKSLLECLPGRISVEEWGRHFKNITTAEDASPGYWHNSKRLTRWVNAPTVSKLGVKKDPLKHKDLLQKPKLLCIQGKPKAKSLGWIKGILRIKEENSNLLRKSKLYCLQGKSREWTKGILSIEEENSNWVSTTDISLGLKALMIECKNYSDSENVYDMKALTDACETLEKEKQITKDTLMDDFKALIKECENLEEIYEAGREDYGSRYQNSNEVNANELAGYLDNTLHIPKEMSVMAKSMYT